MMILPYSLKNQRFGKVNSKKYALFLASSAEKELHKSYYKIVAKNLAQPTSYDVLILLFDYLSRSSAYEDVLPEFMLYTDYIRLACHFQERSFFSRRKSDIDHLSACLMDMAKLGMSRFVSKEEIYVLFAELQKKIEKFILFLTEMSVSLRLWDAEDWEQYTTNYVDTAVLEICAKILICFFEQNRDESILQDVNRTIEAAAKNFLAKGELRIPMWKTKILRKKPSVITSYVYSNFYGEQSYTEIVKALCKSDVIAFLIKQIEDTASFITEMNLKYNFIKNRTHLKMLLPESNEVFEIKEIKRMQQIFK